MYQNKVKEGGDEESVVILFVLVSKALSTRQCRHRGNKRLEK
jgi:hypothetical protein